MHGSRPLRRLICKNRCNADSACAAFSPRVHPLMEDSLAKLKVDFVAELGLEEFSFGNMALTKLIPYANARAIAFGWAWNSAAGMLGERYWLADVRREGVRRHLLPESLTERLNLLLDRKPMTGHGEMRIQAFKFGEGFGLLIGSQEVHLYAGIDEEPDVIAIDNDFSMHGTPRHATSKYDSHYVPEHCGNASGALVPVIFAGPGDRHQSGRHASLLEIDGDARKARWLLTHADGAPGTTRVEDYRQFCVNGREGGARLDLQAGLVWDRPAVLHDCAWIGGAWHCYTAGFSYPYLRYGIATGPSVLARHRPDLTLDTELFLPREESLGRICASLDRAIITPLRKNGITKGKQSIYRYADGQEHEVGLPRGYAKHLVEEYLDRRYWLLPMPPGYRNNQVVACTADD